MKNLISTFTFLFVINFSFSQTTVSGGIFVNTTWTIAGSPYILIDTVVVFPGLTLTIQPGVEVKFENNVQLELRNSNLVALGTASDSITFTSNSSLPVIGSWGNIFLNWTSGVHNINMNFCNFRYAKCAIKGYYYEATIQNSKFESNITAIDYDFYLAGPLTIDSSYFKNNTVGITSYNGLIYVYSSIFMNGQTGIDVQGTTLYLNSCRFSNFGNCGVYTNGGGLSISKCVSSKNSTGVNLVNSGMFIFDNNSIDSNSIEGIRVELQSGGNFKNSRIRNNGIGYHSLWTSSPLNIDHNIFTNNDIGIKTDLSISGPSDNFTCNYICNSISYNFYNNTSDNINISGNYWCSSNISDISTTIYDAYDNVSKGIVFFTPIDTTCAISLTSESRDLTLESFIVFPNPAEDILNISTTSLLSKVTLYNALGTVVYYNSNANSTGLQIDISSLKSGMYFLNLEGESGTVTKKIIKK